MSGRDMVFGSVPGGDAAEWLACLERIIGAVSRRKVPWTWALTRHGRGRPRQSEHQCVERHATPLELGGDAAHEFAHVERLGQVVVEAGFKRDSDLVWCRIG